MPGSRLHHHPDRRRRRAAGAVLEGPQVGVRRRRPDQPRLLRAGRGDPPHRPARGASQDRQAGGRAGPQGGQRLPRRRRQPPSPGAVRRRGRGPGGAGRGGVRRDPAGLPGARRLDHRRARRRLRQEAVHAQAVRRRRPGGHAVAALRLRPRGALQPRQGVPDPAAVRGGARPPSGPPGRGRRPGRGVLTVAATLDGLERDDLVRPATGADAVDGVQAELVAEPASVEEASRVLAAVSRAAKKVVVVGNGSKLGLGNPPERVDLIVRTRRMDRVLEHAAGDLVVKVEAGARLADLQAALAPAGQWLVRDLIIGITVVLADGTVARAGGKVVKNVAGYDLSKLFCGSLGTLGLIAEATFRLHPRPAAAAVVTLQVQGPEQLGEAVRRLLRSTLVPSAIELTELTWYDRSGLLTVVFEGIQPGVEAQAAAAARLLGEVGEAEVLGPGGTEAALSRLGAPPWEKAEVGIKVAVPPAELPGALTDLWSGWLGHGRIAAHAGTGVLEVGLGGPDLASAEQVEAFVGVVAKARAALAVRQGTLVVAEAPPALKRVVDVWGPPGDAVELMRRVKRQFDPDRQMSPGRFVGGI